MDNTKEKPIKHIDIKDLLIIEDIIDDELPIIIIKRTKIKDKFK
jgi:hypothetical protein